MTHPSLANLTLDESAIAVFTRVALGVPYFGTNPFVADSSIKDFDVWTAKASGWWADWLQEDRGRDEAVQAHVRTPRWRSAPR